MTTLQTALGNRGSYPLNDIVGIDPRDYGAIGDGVVRPVSQWLEGGVLDRDYANLAAIQVDHPHVVTLNDSLDWVGLQGACNAAIVPDGSLGQPKYTVAVPRGNWMINRTLVCGVPMKGLGYAHSRIWAASGTYSFYTVGGTDTPMIRLSLTESDGTGFTGKEYGPSLHSLQVRGGAQGVGIFCDIGVEAYNWNEHSGLFDCDVLGFVKKAVVVGSEDATNVNNFRLWNSSMGSDIANDSCIALHIQYVDSPIQIERFTSRVQKTTLVGGSTSNNILIENVGTNCVVVIRNSHFEWSENGVNASSGYVTVKNCDGFHVNHVVRMSGSARGWAELITTNSQNATLVACRDETTPLRNASPIEHGVNVMTRRYVFGGELGKGSYSGFATATSTADGYRTVAHGMPDAPRWVHAMNESDNRRLLITLKPDATNLNFRIWNDETGAWLASIASKIIWEAEL
jgi:hypothetical protein